VRLKVVAAMREAIDPIRADVAALARELATLQAIVLHAPAPADDADDVVGVPPS
jgi:hypothetical protein